MIQYIDYYLPLSPLNKDSLYALLENKKDSFNIFKLFIEYYGLKVNQTDANRVLISPNYEMVRYFFDDKDDILL